MEELPLKMKKSFSKAKEMIESSQDIKIYSHNDCDGISAGAILSTILDRHEKDHEIEIVSLDKLDDLEIEHELTLFSDLGSGQNVDKLANNSSKILILDHHPPLHDLNYKENVSHDHLEINPIHHGIDGSYHVSGGGLSYFLAREFEYYDLSWIGVLSAIGDMQNSRTGKLEGLNSIILKDSIDQGHVQSINDLSLYGRQTRPLFVALSYFSDVNLPITNNRTESIALMKDLGIPRKIGNRSRTLSDLDNVEKGKLFSELVKMLSKEVPKRYIPHVPKLVAADSYEFMMEDDHTFLRDASEFSTAMNACTRNNREDIALEILKGDRISALDELEIVSKEHRRYLAQNIHKIEEEDMITSMDNIQYFDGNGIKSQVVGTIAGMILSYGDWRKPMIGFTQVSDEDEALKVSLRCSRLLAYDGIHFGNIIRKVSQSVGGSGGGHSVACGAYIPYDKKEEFLTKFNSTITGMV
ncbi:hypothetical protein ALNOE001_13840 [Candidatus Methanobinarius endosymbioticus]|uniref:Uncharacterized protein n=1 Tax=Candidatus Methanobinarius endosymbioticus TaxID=2006182 RepID=A0A366MBM8_9EURY|nr:hypothetical protein ALNOE001_13840 [Candidatus Methanobinarius endosymbioticus]